MTYPEYLLTVRKAQLWVVFFVCLIGAFAAQAQTLEQMKTFRPKLDASLKSVNPAKTTDKGAYIPRKNFQLQDNARLDSLLDTLHAYNSRIKGVAGYRLLVYTGMDREQAMKNKEILYRNYPELEVYVTFVQPTFKIKVGDYLNRYDALRGANRIKGQFPSAVVVGETVRVR